MRKDDLLADNLQELVTKMQASFKGITNACSVFLEILSQQKLLKPKPKRTISIKHNKLTPPRPFNSELLIEENKLIDSRINEIEDLSDCLPATFGMNTMEALEQLEYPIFDLTETNATPPQFQAFFQMAKSRILERNPFASIEEVRREAQETWKKFPNDQAKIHYMQAQSKAKFKRRPTKDLNRDESKVNSDFSAKFQRLLDEKPKRDLMAERISEKEKQVKIDRENRQKMECENKQKMEIAELQYEISKEREKEKVEDDSKLRKIFEKFES